MSLKKTNLSNIIWFFFGITVLTFSYLIFARLADYFLIDKGVGLAFTAVLFGLSVLFVLLGTAKKRKSEKQEHAEPLVISEKSIKIFDIITFALLGLMILAGIFLRLKDLGNSGFLADVLENAQIPFYPTDRTLSGSVAGSYYFSFLEFLFFVFGNFGETVIILNTVLFALSTVLLFFGVKKILGNFATLAVTAFMTLSPFVVTANAYKGPELMALVFMSIAVLFVSEVLPGGTLKIAPSLFCGVFIGITIAIDFSCAAFLFVIPLLFIKEYSCTEKKENAVSRLISLAVFIVSLTLGYIFAILIYSGIMERGFAEAFSKVYNGVSLYSNPVHSFEHIDLISGALISVLLMIGIAAGFLRKKIDQGIVIAIIIIGVSGLSSLGLSGISDGCGMFTLALFSSMAGHTLDNLVLRNKTLPEKKNSEEEEFKREFPKDTVPFATNSLALTIPGISHIKNDLTQRSGDESEAGFDIKEEGNNPDTEGNETRANNDNIALPGTPLENPLPVPEHKSRKAVDYDYYVSENADYDY